MNCLNEETIQRFLDRDLSEKEMEGVFAHLEGCDICLEKTMATAASNKELISVLTGSRNTVPHLPHRKVCLSKKLLLGYVAEGLNDADKKLVESHLEICNPCMEEMMELQKSYLNEAELDFDTVALISALKDNHHEDILTIVLKDVGRRVFEVIETTGTILTAHFPSLEAARGKEVPSESESIHIRQDFPDKSISAEIAIKKGRIPDTCDIRLSLMKMKGNDISGILESARVSISGIGIEWDAVTDEKGEVEFKDLSYGNYKIKASDSGLEAEVSIGEK